MDLKVTFEAQTIHEDGTHRCMSSQGEPHGARWLFAFRLEQRGMILTEEKGARHGYACDAHLYPLAQYVHNELQAGQVLRGTLSVS